MADKDQYRSTLQLPETDFPMKAKLPEREPEIIKKWNDLKIYQKIMEKRKSAELFFLPDGPPYANGAVHIGTALNKILKDIVIKYKNLRGFKAPFPPAWDCHGLPIELSAAGKSNEALSDQELRKLCRREALFWAKEQLRTFQRLGVLADWEKPVFTMDPEYEAEELRAFADLADKGLIYRGEKPVFWCFKLQTALAFSEAEYKEHKSPSIYVRFYLEEDSVKKLGAAGPAAAVIWTTTPWTLPANSAIAFHPDLEYGLYEGEKESVIIACALAENFFKETESPVLKKKKTFKGSRLEGLIGRHPFIDRKSPLAPAEHVSLEAGTGLVHIAPGHGLEDFIVGKKQGLEIFCPVDERGHFTKDLPEDLQGQFILKGNKIIIEKIKNSGHLAGYKEIIHSYPYSPRSNSPLIYRLTPQWFLSLDKPPEGGSQGARAQALAAAAAEICFIPDWGRARLEAMIKSSPDWCLSRQRAWGVPIPVFYCQNCSEPLLDSKIIRGIAAEMERSGRGIDYYFDEEESVLLPKGFRCGSCGGADFKKGKDILDVWFDSGIQHRFFSEKKQLPFPADLFLEGSDQHRGWFQTSLTSSLALTGKAPFKTLLTHGFVCDKKGRKMSKSLGNVLSPSSVIQKSGAEILRLWAASLNYSFDINAGEESFQRAVESYRRFRNTFRFILGNLKGFDHLKDFIKFKELSLSDKWILGRLNSLIKESLKDFDQFAFYKVYQRLNYFFTVSLSSFYLDIIKDRLYTFAEGSRPRRSAQTVLRLLIEKLLPLMSPLASFLCEEAYSYLPGKKQESVFLEDFPEPVFEWEDNSSVAFFDKIFPLREELNKQLEELRRQGAIGSNLQASAEIVLEKDFISPVMNEQERLEFFGVSQLTICEGSLAAVKSAKAKGGKCPRCWFISEKQDEKGLCLKCSRNL